jgi:uncharacterized membrane protein YeaQ/YmgE (transglycosylase-associated protein family)
MQAKAGAGTVSDRGRLQPRQNWGRQILGAAVGAVVLLLAVQLGPYFGWQPVDVYKPLLWGAAIGATVASFEGVVQAGSKLTHRDSTWLNVIVAVVGAAVMVAALAGLVRLIAWLIWK